MADATSTLSRKSVTWLLTAVLSGSLVSCATDDYYAGDDNIFLNRRPPRYGHGGTENPRYRFGANSEREESETRSRRSSNSRERDTADREEESRSRRRSEEKSEPRRSEREVARERDREATPETRSSDREERERERERSTAATTPSSSESEPSKPKLDVKDIPYAQPVPGADGVVYSPYTNQKVDVKGMAPGALAKDPVSKKIFRVP